MTLKHKTFSAVRWTTTAAVVRALLQIAQVSVLARLLTPEDYGLMAIVVVVSGFAVLFADLGLNSAYVQRQNITSEQRSSLFWLNIIMGAILTALVVGVSPLISWFFGENRLTPLLMLSATTFVINSIGQQVRIVAEKKLDFRPVVMVEIGSAATGFVSAVIAALAGLGVYALVVGTIVTAFTGSLFAWLFVAQGWRPLWRFNINDVRPFLGFGGAMVGNGIVSQIIMSIDLLLGGRMLIASQLGLYSVPRNFVLQLQFMVNPIITKVGFPLISKVQSDINQIRSIYLKTLNMTAATNAPLYVGLAFFAPDVVQILLGSDWLESAVYLRILAFWGFLRSIANPVGSLLFGVGRADLALKWNIFLLIVIPPSLLIGSHFGPSGLAWSLLIISAVLYIPGWYFLVRPLCLAGLYEYVKASLRPFVLAMLSIAPAAFVTVSLGDPYIRLIIATAISVPTYLFLSYRTNREWYVAMIELLSRRAVA